MPTVDAGDHGPLNRVWSEASGPVDAPAIILVHGSMDRSAGLLRLSRRLSDRFRVIRYDRRGYARSAGVGPPYCVNDNVDDIIGVVTDHTAGRGVVLAFGHSFGGNVALGLAARRPDLVGRVAVYETPLSWLPWWPTHTAGGAAMSQADPADAAEAFMRRMVGDDKWERLPPSSRASRRSEGPAMVGELADLRRAAPWNASTIVGPVMSMVGERARTHHLQAMETLTELLADCRIVTIPGAGHPGPNTHADLVSASLVNFLAATEQSDG